MARIYKFPFRTYCPEKCAACKGLGQKSTSDRTLVELRASISKAKSGNYRSILLPCNSVYSGDLAKFVGEIVSSGLAPIVQINAKSYNPQWELEFNQFPQANFQIVIDEWSESIATKVTQFLGKNLNRSGLIAVTYQLPIWEVVTHFRDSKSDRVSYYFPLKLNEDNESYLDTDGVIQVLKKLRFTDSIYPLSGLDVHDPRIQDDSNLEPNVRAENLGWEDSVLPFKKKFSVVIPSFNNAAYVKNTVRHLSKQTMRIEDFEVIVVDDGSTDGTREKLLALQESLTQPVHLKYIYFPRPTERKMGDGQFRAGIARNLGVKSAVGDYLCFLDSDIITPTNFLETLLVQHQSFDVIQTKRIYLKESVSSEFTDYDEVNELSDVFVPEGGYWQKFYDDPVPWNERKGNWKYACTYNFSLKREKFIAIGWFRKNYHFYGFEDTDLGLRLVRDGAKLLLSDLRVYHLFHANDKSEFKNSDYLRQMVLRKTAKIFFHNSLDLEIYEQLGGLLAERTIWSMIRIGLRSMLNPLPLERSLKQIPRQNAQPLNHS